MKTLKSDIFYAMNEINDKYPRGCTMFRAKKRKRYFLTKE